MNKEIKIIGIIFILLFALFILTSCDNRKIKDGVMAGEPAPQATLYTHIIDKDTKEPIEDVIFYFGNGFWGSRTDSQGKCVSEVTATGSYSLNAYKKGYERFSNGSILKAGDNYLTIELEKSEVFPQSFSVEGEVIEIVAAKGSKSENHFIKLKHDGKEEYIFNSIGNNEVDSKFIGKKVRIKGYTGTGFIGWQHQEMEGIYIEEIEII